MPDFEDVTVGDRLPALAKVAQRLDSVLYAAGSGDFNPLHFDPDNPQAQQLGDNIVHGRMKFAALGELVSGWLGHAGRIVSIECQYRGIDKRAAGFSCHGRVVATDASARAVELEVWTEDADGRRTTPGRARVVFAEPAAAV